MYVRPTGMSKDKHSETLYWTRLCFPLNFLVINYVDSGLSLLRLSKDQVEGIFFGFHLNIYSIYKNENCVWQWKCILTRSNKMQQMQVFITSNLLYKFRASIDPIIRSTSNCNHSLWYRSYHVSDKDLLPAWPNKATLAEGRCPDTWYDLYQRLWLQFDVLLMMGSIDARNMYSKFVVINTCTCCILLI